MKTTPEIEEYVKEVNAVLWPNSPSMQAYAAKSVAAVYRTEDGYMVPFEKESIETHFCFGHGFCGVTTAKDEARAEEMAQNAKEHAGHFMRENLKNIDGEIARLKKGNAGLFRTYEKSGKICNVLVNDGDFEGKCFELNRKFFVRMLTEEERKGLLKVAEDVREKRVKLLNAYLKRYGLTKVKTWAYVSD